MNLSDTLKKAGIYLLIVLCSALIGIASPIGDKDLSDAMQIIDIAGGGSNAIIDMQKNIKTMQKDIETIMKGQVKPDVDLMAFHLSGKTTIHQVQAMFDEWVDAEWGSQQTARDTIRDNPLARKMLIDRGFDEKLVNALCTYK